MLKRDLVNVITEQMDGYLKKDVSYAINIVLATISEALVKKQRVEIRGFGSFSVRQRAARTTKTPGTGKVMLIPPRKNIHFTMSKSLKDGLINK